MFDIFIYIASIVAIYLIVVNPLNLMQGYAGLLSLSLAANFGLGAYGAAIAGIHLGLSLAPALLVGVLVSVVAQAAMSYPSLGLGMLYFVVATLAFQFIFLSIFDNWVSVTGGAAGLFGLPLPRLFGMDASGTRVYALLLMATLAANTVLSWRLARSRLGLQLRGTRDNGVAMVALGHNIRRLKVLVAVYYAAWAGLAGGLYANLLSIVSPSDFDIHQSILLQAFVIVGGAGHFWAPFVAVPLLVGFPESLRYMGIPDTVSGPVREGLYGLLLILLMRFRPQGLLPERAVDAGPGWLARTGPSKLDGIGRGAEADDGSVSLDNGSQPAADAGMLEVKDLSKRFGGVQALRNVDLTVKEGQITALIGPNGAGKSTLLNVITGFLPCESGSVRFEGRDLKSLTAYERVHLGMARSFQDSRSFESLTVRQSIYLSLSARLAEEAIEEEIGHYVRRFGLERHAERRVTDLSYGDQKLVSFAITAATGARLLFLDEPTSGLDAGQIANVHGILKSLSTEGRTICLVEHNMDFVRAIADHVYVLHQGAVLIDGAAEDVLAHKRTLEVYLGG